MLGPDAYSLSVGLPARTSTVHFSFLLPINFCVNVLGSPSTNYELLNSVAPSLLDNAGPAATFAICPSQQRRFMALEIAVVPGGAVTVSRVGGSRGEGSTDHTDASLPLCAFIDKTTRRPIEISASLNISYEESSRFCCIVLELLPPGAPKKIVRARFAMDAMFTDMQQSGFDVHFQSRLCGGQRRGNTGDWNSDADGNEVLWQVFSSSKALLREPPSIPAPSPAPSLPLPPAAPATRSPFSYDNRIVNPFMSAASTNNNNNNNNNNNSNNTDNNNKFVTGFASAWYPSLPLMTMMQQQFCAPPPGMMTPYQGEVAAASSPAMSAASVLPQPQQQHQQQHYQPLSLSNFFLPGQNHNAAHSGHNDDDDAPLLSKNSASSSFDGYDDDDSALSTSSSSSDDSADNNGIVLGSVVTSPHQHHQHQQHTIATGRVVADHGNNYSANNNNNNNMNMNMNNSSDNMLMMMPLLAPLPVSLQQRSPSLVPAAQTKQDRQAVRNQIKEEQRRIQREAKAVIKAEKKAAREALKEEKKKEKAARTQEKKEEKKSKKTKNG